MADGIISTVYNRAIVDSIPDLATWLLGDVTAPVNVALYVNDVVPDPTEGNGQFVEASFTGYARKAFPLTGQAPIVVNEPGTGALLVKLGPGVIFQPTVDPIVPVSVYGWYVINPDQTSAIQLAGRFSEPIVLTTLDDYIEVEPAVRIMLSGINAVDQANV